jgi:hypothetical protein
MKKENSWFTVLFTLLFVIVPGLLMWYFLSKDWNQSELDFEWVLLISLSFLIIIFVLIWIFIKLKFCYYQVYNVALPMCLVMVSIVLSSWIDSVWIRAIIILIWVFFTLPINIITNKIIKNKEIQAKAQSNK